MEKEKIYPFKHLAAYEREDKTFYFGREKETNELYQMTFETDLILVYGASGVGKSSLIRCGLSNKFKWYEWLDISVRRGNNINDSLTEELNKQIDTEDKTVDIAEQIRQLRRQHFMPIYLIFDQFEELYISGNEAEQNQFYASVRKILSLNQPIKIIISIREEYLGYLYDFEKEIPHLFSHKCWVQALKLEVKNEGTNIIDEILQGVIDHKEESIVSIPDSDKEELAGGIKQMFGNAGAKTVDLPSLQILFDELYLSQTDDSNFKTETVFSYDKLKEKLNGNIQDILWKYLERLVNDLLKNKKVKPDIIWGFLRELVTDTGTKKNLSEKELKENADFSELEIAQITTFFGKNDEKKENNILNAITHNGESRWELRHDVLAKCISEKLDSELRLKKLIEVKMSSQSKDDYLTPFQLNEIDKCKERLLLTGEQKEFVEQSRKKVLRKQLKRKLTLIGAVLITLLSIGIALFLGIERKTHEYYADYVDRWGMPQGIIKIENDLLKNRHFRYHFIYTTKGFNKIHLDKVIYEDNNGKPQVHENAELLGRAEESVREFIYNRKTNEADSIIIKNEKEEVIFIRFFAKKQGEETDIEKSVQKADSIIIKNEKDDVVSTHSVAKKQGEADMKMVVQSDEKLQGDERGLMEGQYEMNYTEINDREIFLSCNEKGYLSRIEYKYNGISFYFNEFNWSNEGSSYSEKIATDSLGRRKTITYLDKRGLQTSRNNINKIEYEYDDFGNISQIKHIGDDGQPVLNKKGWAIEKDSADNYGNTIQKNYYDENGKYIKKQCAKITRKYKNGYLTEEAYWDEKGLPYKKNESFKLENTSYSGDNTKTTWHLTGNEEEIIKWDKNEEHIKFKRLYDKKGNIVEWKVYWYGKENPSQTVTYKYDDKGGNLMEQSVYHHNNASDTIRRVVKYIYKYDIEGHKIEESLWDKDDQPYFYNHHGTQDSIVKTIWKYENGKMIEQAYFGMDGKLRAKYSYGDTYGIARTTWKYDEQGNLMKATYYDVNNNVILKNGLNRGFSGYEGHYFPKRTQKYERGNVVEESYFDVENKPFAKIDEAVKVTWKYDSITNFPIEKSYWGKNGERVLAREPYSRYQNGFTVNRHYATVKWKYDSQNHITRMSFFGTDGRPCERYGVAVHKWKYDLLDRKVEESYYGTNGKPCAVNNVAKIIWKYDDNDYTVTCLDIKGKPCRQIFRDGNGLLHEDNPGAEIADYKRFGFYIDRNIYDSKGKKLENIVKYDEQENIIERINFRQERAHPYSYMMDKVPQQEIITNIKRYYDTGNIKEEVDSCATYKNKKKFDEQGLKIEETYRNNSKNGYKKLWDKQGNLIEDIEYKNDKKTKEDKYKYNEQGKKIEETLWKAENNETHKTLWDEQGNLIEDVEYKNDKKTKEDKYKYDGQKRIIEQSHWELATLENYTLNTINDIQYLNNARDAIIFNKNTFDENKIDEKLSQYAEIEKQVNWKNKHDYKITYQYDEQSHIIEAAFFKTDNTPILSSGDYSKVKKKFDESGNMIEQAFFGTEGQPILSTEGYAKGQKKYDEQGHCIEEAFFGVDGNPIQIDGYAKIEKKYDKYGNIVEEAFFGADNKPVFIEKYGYAKQTMKYDRYGNQIFYAYYDAQGNLCKPKDFNGGKRITRRFNKKGEISLYIGVHDVNELVKKPSSPYLFIWKITFADGLCGPGIIIKNNYYILSIHKKYIPLFILVGIVSIAGGFIFHRKKRRLYKWLCWGVAGASVLSLVVLYGYLLLA
jgi:antitoxin component YwqK of YwqJK toxin-antitoxin module